MKTTVLFTLNNGIPVPDVLTIPIAQGDSFELSVAAEASAVIYFSPALAAIVTPAPGTSVTLSPGAPATFTFSSSAPGAYSLVAAPQDSPAPTHFRSVPSSHVSVEASFQPSAAAFPVDGGRTASNN